MKEEVYNWDGGLYLRVLLSLILILFLFRANKVSGQEKFTVSGTVTSEKTGERLINASVKVADKSIGTITNDYGFFSLSLVKGNYTIEISSIGLQEKTIELLLEKNFKLNIALDDKEQKLQDVTVKSSMGARSLSSPQMSVERLNVQEIKNIPVLFGERDVMKTIQLLPGIKAASEGNSGFFVRGGAADQNLILLDEAPVYNASHLLGFFSTFNSDAIKDITVYILHKTVTVS